MTKEQQKALALAKARRRRVEAGTEAYMADLTASPLPREGLLGPAPTIEDMAASYKPDTRPQAEKMRGMGRGRDMGPVMSALIGGSQGATLGVADEVISRAMSLSPNIDYADALEFNRGLIEGARDKHPVSAFGGEIVGSAALPLGTVASSGTMPVRMARSAGAGGLLGAMYGFGAGEGGGAERARNALGAGLLSAGVGAAIPLMGSMAQRIYAGAEEKAAMRAAAASAPSGDDLRAGAGAIYGAAENVPLPRDGFANAAQGMVGDATRRGLDADLTPGAAKVADRIVDAATDPSPNLSFRELDILRRKAAIPAGNLSNPTESAIGSRFVDALDDFVDDVDPTLSSQIDKARNMWGRLRRSEMIETAIAKAKDQASGFENGLRAQFRAILNDPKKLRGFSEPEVKAIRAVVRGTTFGNLLRKVGVMGLSAGAGGSGLGAASGAGFGATVGSVLGGPIGGAIGAVIPPVAGSLAKMAAERGTAGRANLARGLTAAGGLIAPPRLLPTAGAESALQRGLLPVLEPYGPQALSLLGNVQVN